MAPESTSGRPESDTPTACSAVECQQCGTITTIDFHHRLPTTCGFCGAKEDHLIEL